MDYSKNNQKSTENMYRNYLENMQTPFERIQKVTRFTPVPQETQINYNVTNNLPV